MAIERLQLETPELIQYGESPFNVAGRLALQYRSEFQTLEPGVYDITPENTGYAEMAHRCRLTVLDDGTGFEEAIDAPGTTSIIHDPEHCVVEREAQSLPGYITSLSIVAFYRPNKLLGVGRPHMFDVLRWRSQDGEPPQRVRRMPGVAIILAIEITPEDLVRTGLV